MAIIIRKLISIRSAHLCNNPIKKLCNNPIDKFLVNEKAETGISPLIINKIHGNIANHAFRSPRCYMMLYRTHSSKFSKLLQYRCKVVEMLLLRFGIFHIFLSMSSEKSNSKQYRSSFLAILFVIVVKKIARELQWQRCCRR